MVPDQKTKKHISLTFGAEMDQLIQPLSKIGISLFIYLRIYPDRKWIFLSNKMQWTEYYLIKHYQDLYTDTFELGEYVNHCLFLVPEMYPENLSFQEIKGMIGIKSGIILPRKYNLYKEVCYIASEKMDAYQYNFYMDNLEYFSRFILYFREKAQRLIKIAEKSKHDPPTNFFYAPTYKPAFHKFEESVQHIYLPSDPNQTPISPREIECIKWLIQGKSVKEIAIELTISPRTVETYINNLKIKFECEKSTQLIYKLAKLGLNFQNI